MTEKLVTTHESSHRVYMPHYVSGACKSGPNFLRTTANFPYTEITPDLMSLLHPQNLSYFSWAHTTNGLKRPMINIALGKRINSVQPVPTHTGY